jgi:hypothetical protein
MPCWPIPIVPSEWPTPPTAAEMARLCGRDLASGLAFRRSAGGAAARMVRVLPAKLTADRAAGCNRQICATQHHDRSREGAQLTRSHFSHSHFRREFPAPARSHARSATSAGSAAC